MWVKHMRRSGWLSAFLPGYFSLSMSTGIIAIASRLFHYGLAGYTFFAANFAVYFVLWVINLARFLLHPQAVITDLRSHQKGPTFLTVVAATSLIGCQCAEFTFCVWLLPWVVAASLSLWIALVYGVLSALTLSAVKPDVEHGLNGSWFLFVVATESLSILGSAILQVAPELVDPRLVAFASLSAWLLGVVLYLMLLGLVFFRWVFVPMKGGEMTEPWWINMGGAAIATLAGSELLSTRQLQSLWPFLDPFTVLCWAIASFWIPLLAIMFIHKYLVQWRNLKYSAGIWSMVFPLGMYAAATESFAMGTGLTFLHRLAHGFYFLALAAWCVAAVGLFCSLPWKGQKLKS